MPMTDVGGWHSYHQTMPRKPAATSSGDSKSERTRSRILDAAAHVLSVKGFAGTRLTDVAEYAELQAPAIYYYFASREDLIEEVMFRGISDLRGYLQDALDALPSGTAPMDRILTAVETHLRHELELSDYARASIRNSGQIPERLRTRQQKERAAYDRIWQALMADAVADGQIRDDLDARLARALVLGALNWAAEWWDPRRSSVDAMISNAQAFVRHGLSPVNLPRKRAAKTKTKTKTKTRTRR
jgi:AcrR family transcriptional regulator